MMERFLQTGGGWKSIPVDSKNVDSIVSFGLVQMTSTTGLLSEGVFSCSGVLSVQKQIVAGINYKIVAEFTNADTQSTQTIEFTVYVDLQGTMTLTSSTELMMSTFENVVVGGWSSVDGVKGKTIEELVNVGVAAMTAPSGLLGATEDWKCDEVLQVEKQVVNGMIYKITGTFSNSLGASENVLFVVYVAPGAEPVYQTGTILMMIWVWFLKEFIHIGIFVW